MRIVIDAGHSGDVEPGAVNANTGDRECDINLKMSKLIVDKLNNVGLNIVAWATRDSDIDNDRLFWRAEMANDLGADLFVSIHCNAHTNPNATGTEIWHYMDSVVGEHIAEHLAPNIACAMGLRNRGAKAGQFAVLRQTVMPAILIELGFISNANDLVALMDAEKNNLVATAIVEGILTSGV